jgi:plasmid stabilization system protein ParE
VNRYRIEFSPEAASHVEAIATWWTANRPAAPLLFADELRAGLRQLQRAPHSGQVYAPSGVRPTRRLLLPKCAHHIYYAADDEAGTVRVYAVWHTSRGERPAVPR